MNFIKMARLVLLSGLLLAPGAWAGESGPSGESCWDLPPIPLASDTVFEVVPEQGAELTFIPRVAGTVSAAGGSPSARRLDATGGTLRIDRGSVIATAAETDGRRTRLWQGESFDLVEARLAPGADAPIDAAGRFEAGVPIPVTLPEDGHLSIQIRKDSPVSPLVDIFDPENRLVREHVMRSSLLPSADPSNALVVWIREPGAERYIVEHPTELRACIQTPDKVMSVPVMAVEQIKGAVRVTLDLPRELRPRLVDWNAKVGIMTLDGHFMARDDFWMHGTVVAFVGAGLALYAGHFLTRRMVLRRTGGRWLDWFSGPGGAPSMSLFQIYLWSWVVFAGLIYVAILTGEFFAITPEVLILLGIAGTGSVAARIIASAQGPATIQTKPAAFAEVFQTDGHFDLYKLQIFLFTVTTGAYVIIRIVIDQAFPALDPNLLLLLGISNGIYVGSKFGVADNPVQQAALLDSQIKGLETARAAATVEVDTLGIQRGKLAGEIRAKDDALAAPGIDEATKARLGEEKRALETQGALTERRLTEAQARVTDLGKQIEETRKAYDAAVARIGK